MNLFCWAVFLAAALPGSLTEPFAVAVSERVSVSAGAAADISVDVTIPHGYYLYADALKVVFSLPSGYESYGPVAPPKPVRRFDPALNEAESVYSESFRLVYRIRVPKDAPEGDVKIPMSVSYRGCSETSCFRPRTVAHVVVLRVAGRAATGGTVASATGREAAGPGTGRRGIESAVEGRVRSALATGSLLRFLPLAFLTGLLLYLTPCIYPMIPVTLSAIGARTLGKPLRGFILSVAYVFGLSITYAVLGVVAALVGGRFGAAVSTPYVIVPVILVFVALALSMFDLFEIAMPSFIADRLSSVARRRSASTSEDTGAPVFPSVVGAWLFGLVAGLVISPCVSGPLLAFLTEIARTQDVVLGFFSLFAVAWGMGLPLIVIGTFPSVLSSLPSSGEWMLTVKRFFGVVLLGAAIYYLGLLVPRRVELGVWGAFCVVLAVFLGVGQELPVSTRWTDKLVKALGFICLIVGVALLFLSVEGMFSPDSRPPVVETLSPRWRGIESIGATGKPTLIYFTADWCTACRELQTKTWSDPRVISALERFNSVKVDATRETPEIREVLDKHSVLGYPTLIFLDADGKPLPDEIVQGSRLAGFISPDDLLAILSRIR